MHQPLRGCSDVLRKTAKRIIQELTRRMRKKTEIALEGSSAAQHRLARAAIRTHPAGEPRIDVNTIAHGGVGDLTPDLRDHAGGVEPNARGQRRQVIPQPAAEDRVHVGNDAGRLHPNQHIARTWLRNFHRIDPQRLPSLMQARRSHGSGHRFSSCHPPEIRSADREKDSEIRRPGIFRRPSSDLFQNAVCHTLRRSDRR
jgi:hypothetical protein